MRVGVIGLAGRDTLMLKPAQQIVLDSQNSIRRKL
jgi:hypothetical protein